MKRNKFCLNTLETTDICTHKIHEIPSEFQKKIMEDFKTLSYNCIWEFIYDADQRTVYACSSDSWLIVNRKKKSGVWCKSISEEVYRRLLKSGQRKHPV